MSVKEDQWEEASLIEVLTRSTVISCFNEATFHKLKNNDYNIFLFYFLILLKRESF